MPASDPAGQFQFWQSGQPFAGVQKSGNDGGGMQFWVSGQPYPWMFPAAASGPASIKTVNGLAIASIKTLNGLAIASVKGRNGLT